MREARGQLGRFRGFRFRGNAWLSGGSGQSSCLDELLGFSSTPLLPPNCSSCDERVKDQRPGIERYANHWLRKGKIKKPSEAKRAAAYGEAPSRPLRLVAKLRAEAKALRVKQLSVKRKKVIQEEADW